MAYTVVPSTDIKLSEIAGMYGCAVTLSACAAAAGLPSTNIKISDFAGLSAVSSMLNPDIEGGFWDSGSVDYGTATFYVNADGSFVGSESGDGDNWLVDSGGVMQAVTDGSRFTVQCWEVDQSTGSGGYTPSFTIGEQRPIGTSGSVSFDVTNSLANKVCGYTLFMTLYDHQLNTGYDFEVRVWDDSYSED